jgi:hypothetical protein
MLEEIYNVDDKLTEDNYYDALIFMLGDVYPDLSEGELEDKLESIINQTPDEYSESFLDTVGNVGKSIGTGSLKFLAEHPEITQTVGSAVGAYVGGPTGAKLGGSLAKYGNDQLKAKFLPDTAKTLSLMQNPQAQSALTRAALGVGNGTAPLAKDGNISLIPVSIFLRLLLQTTQKALMELDDKNIIPDPKISEGVPYSDDIDRQAEWLGESLVGY